MQARDPDDPELASRRIMNRQTVGEFDRALAGFR